MSVVTYAVRVPRQHPRLPAGIGTCIYPMRTDARACTCADSSDMRTCVDAVGPDTNAGAKYVNTDFCGINRAT